MRNHGSNRGVYIAIFWWILLPKLGKDLSVSLSRVGFSLSLAFLFCQQTLESESNALFFGLKRCFSYFVRIRSYESACESDYRNLGKM